MTVFLDTDGEMTFENKERLNFIMHYLKRGADPSLVEVKNDRFVREDAEIAFNEIWLPCAIMKQKEIDILTAYKDQLLEDIANMHGYTP